MRHSQGKRMIASAALGAAFATLVISSLKRRPETVDECEEIIEAIPADNLDSFSFVTYTPIQAKQLKNDSEKLYMYGLTGIFATLLISFTMILGLPFAIPAVCFTLISVLGAAVVFLFVRADMMAQKAKLLGTEFSDSVAGAFNNCGMEWQDERPLDDLMYNKSQSPPLLVQKALVDGELSVWELFWADQTKTVLAKRFHADSHLPVDDQSHPVDKLEAIPSS